MARQQVVHRRAAGLYSQMNPLSEIPEGALLKAENCVIDREGIISRRRGMDRYGDILSAPATALGEYLRKLIILDGTTLKHDPGTGIWVSWTGSFSAPASGTRMQFWEENNNVYFTTSGGVFKLDSLSGTPVPILAGMPYGLDIQLTLTATAPTWLLANKQVGYRVVWVRRDLNQNLLLGRPAQREVLVSDPTVTKSVQLTTTIPQGVVAGDFYRIYRTEMSANQTTDPGDRHFLLVEAKVSAAQITAGIITYDDTTDEANLGEDLYTNDTQETISQANDRPPFAKYQASYKGHVFLGNTSIEHFAQIQLNRISDITDDTDTITINAGSALVYTFSTAENQGARKFQRFTSGATAIRDTMKSFQKIVNRDPSSLVYVEYVSPVDGAPGQVVIRRKALNTASFTVQASAGAGDNFTPDLTTALTSQNNALANRIIRGKHLRPEAFPALNIMDIGRLNYAILGMKALREGVIVFKEDGVFLISGETDGGGGFNFVVTELDPSLKLLAPASLAVLDNAVFGFTNQGVVRVTEAGSLIVSRPIENELLPLTQFSNFFTLTHAISYESDRKYILFSQETSADTVVKIARVYHTITKSWTTWRKSIGVGLVLSGDDRLYLAHNQDTFILKDRKTLSASNEDYQDETYTITTTAKGTTLDSNGDTVTTVTVAVGSTGIIPEAGWRYQSSLESSNARSVTDLGSGSYALVLEDELITLPTVPFSANMIRPIPIVIEWAPEDAQNVGMLKQFAFLQIYQEEDFALTSEVGFQADTQPAEEYTSEILLPRSIGFGHLWDDPDGVTVPWGDEGHGTSTPNRIQVPRNHQFCRALRVIYKSKYCKEAVNLLQLTYDLRIIGARTERQPA